MKSKESFLKKITEQLNQHEYSNLTKFLEQIDWFSIPHEQIVPREKVRAFIKSIENEETRLNVARFLQKYEDYYFKEPDNGFTTDFGTDPIAEFHRELEFLIKQLTSNGEFSDDKFRKLKKSNEELKKINAEQERKIKELSEIIDKYKHPSRHGKYIPKRLQNAKFDAIIKHLQSEEVLRVVTEPNEYGFRVVTCIHWDASKALFGYFVEKVNDALKLRGARVPLNWKIFEPAVFNYKDLVGEARKALSTYKNSSSLQPERINDVEKVDKAIEIALKIESDPNKDSV